MSVARVFLTGGGGFVGRRVLDEARRTHAVDVIALDRSGSLGGYQGDGVRVIRGDLLRPETYADQLRGCDVVVHLASATGKATAAQQERDTARATEVLLLQARAAGVPRFVYVSSVAAAFPDTRWYPYAAAKRQAEQAVASSGLRYTILRPTMILGEGSPLLAALSTLALLPVIVLPGAGTVRVQPVAVEDVVSAILALVNADAAGNETLDVAGPETVTMRELLQRIREQRRGQRGRVLRIPVGLIQIPLRVLEQVGAGQFLPATAGQFSSFRYDGMASGLSSGSAPRPIVPIAAMLGGDTKPAAARRATDRECRIFTAHLLGMTPDTPVLEAYARAVATVPSLTPRRAGDDALLALARLGRLGAWAADAHASLFARSSVLRQRMVMVLAILETRPPYSGRLDKALGGNGPAALARLAVAGLWNAAGLVVGTILMIPARILVALRGTGS